MWTLGQLISLPIVFVTGLLPYAAYHPDVSANDGTPDAGPLAEYLFRWPRFLPADDRPATRAIARSSRVTDTVPVAPRDLDLVRDLSRREDGLAVVVTMRHDGTAQASVVNAGVLDHPVSAEPVVGFVVRGRRRKLDNLRARPHTTIVFRSGWDWVAVEGEAEVVGSRDGPLPGESETLEVLRLVYAAALGGTTQDWAVMDARMRDEAHTAVLVRVDRVYSNPPE